MRSATWTCPECGIVRGSSDRIEYRVEHRETKGQGRRHTYKLKEMCRACSDETAERERPNKKPTMPQGYDELFSTKETA